jgi:hypothetical protein
MQREFNSGKHTAYALNEDINTFAWFEVKMWVKGH